MSKKSKVSTQRFSKLIEHVVELGILTAAEGDKSLDEYGKLIKSPKLVLFNVKENRLNKFFFFWFP